MAKPNTLRFGKFRVYVEDPDNPGTYIAPCGFTEKSLDLSATSNEDAIPDCDDPDLPAWVARTIATLSAGVRGTGVWNGGAYATWRRLFLAGASFNVRVEFDDTLANGGGYYQGGAVLNNLGHSGSLGQRVQAAVDMASDGEWTWQDAAA